MSAQYPGRREVPRILYFTKHDVFPKMIGRGRDCSCTVHIFWVSFFPRVPVLCFTWMTEHGDERQWFEPLLKGTVINDELVHGPSYTGTHRKKKRRCNFLSLSTQHDLFLDRTTSRPGLLRSFDCLTPVSSILFDKNGLSIIHDKS